MNRLNKAQKDKVKRFAAVSDADEDRAGRPEGSALGSEPARDVLHVALVALRVRERDAAALEKTYGEYRAADGTHDDDIIDAVGIERLCADIGIDPVDPVILNVR